MSTFLIVFCGVLGILWVLGIIPLADWIVDHAVEDTPKEFLSGVFLLFLWPISIPGMKVYKRLKNWSYADEF